MHKPMLRARIKAVAVSAGLLAIDPVSAQVLSQATTPGLLEPNRARPRVIEVPALPVFEPEASIHLASYFTAEDALVGWDILLAQFPSVLSAYDPILRDVDLGEKGRFVRLLAGPMGTEDEALRACAAINGSGGYCVTADPSGAILHPSEGRDP